MKEEKALQEVALSGLKYMKNLIYLTSQEHIHREKIDGKKLSDYILSLRKVVDSSNLTGHARFRRGPIRPPSGQCLMKNTSLTFDVTKPGMVGPTGNEKVHKGSLVRTDPSSTIGGGSLSNEAASSSMFLAPASLILTGKPPINLKRSCQHVNKQDRSVVIFGQSFGLVKCHCNKRICKAKKTIRDISKKTIRVPANGPKVHDIPSDEYSWRKYGQKRIKGSPYLRGYYKCSTKKGCPARKHVEIARDDPEVIVVTYEGEHQHMKGAMKPTIVAGVQSNA